MHSFAELGAAQAACLHVIASTPNFILANQCMYDWYDDDYIKGGKMPFEGAFLRVPEDAGLGVELDRQKMSKYHEMYQERGMFSVFGLNPEELRTAPPPLFPSY